MVPPDPRMSRRRSSTPRSRPRRVCSTPRTIVRACHSLPLRQRSGSPVQPPRRDRNLSQAWGQARPRAKPLLGRRRPSRCLRADQDAVAGRVAARFDEAEQSVLPPLQASHPRTSSHITRRDRAPEAAGPSTRRSQRWFADIRPMLAPARPCLTFGACAGRTHLRRTQERVLCSLFAQRDRSGRQPATTPFRACLSREFCPRANS
jgi:hypothetical protein